MLACIGIDFRAHKTQDACPILLCQQPPSMNANCFALA